MKFVFASSLFVFTATAFSTASACEIAKEFETYNKSMVSGPASKPIDPVKGLKYMPSAEAAELVKNPSYVFVDTRPASLNKDCTIKDSVNLEYTFNGTDGEKKYGTGARLTKAAVEKFISEGKTVVFFCNSLTCHRSSNAAIQAACEWKLPANNLRWYGEGVPGMFNAKKRFVIGDKCNF
jgi:hypothetical protein